MGLKERRAEADVLVRTAREAGGELPPRTLAAQGYAFHLAGLELHLSILGQPIAPLELTLSELRGKLERVAGAPPYRSEALSEAFTYPVLLAGPDGLVTEAYLFHGAEGPSLGGDEAK